MLSAVLTLFGWFFCSWMMELVHTPENIFSEGEFYLKIYVYGLTFLFLYNVCTGIFTALGDSRTPLYFLIGSSLGNIFLDFWFVAGLGLGDLYCSGDFRCTGTCDAEVPAYEDFL